MANLFPDIVPGVTTGSVAATVLNALGRSDESAIKIVSGSSVLSTESGYYKEGTLVLTKDSGKFYLFDSGNWIDSGSVISTISGITGSSVMSDTTGSVIKHNVSGITSGSYNILEVDSYGHVTSGSSFVAGSGISISGLTISRNVPYVLLQDQKSQNTAGGSFTAAAWRTRDINTEVIDTGNICTISGSNQFSLQSGTYRCRISTPAYSVDFHQPVLYNVSASAIQVIGAGMFCNDTNNVANRAWIIGYFTIAGSALFEIQEWCTVTKATNGFGNAGNITTEIYTEAEFWKEA